MRTSTTVITTLTCLLCLSLATSDAGAEDSARVQFEPVETDMHEFMEYSFQPFFKQLREAMKAAPADKNGWKPIKATSLVLAENGNLLMMRGPDDARVKWNQLAADLRAEGKLLYQQAKKRDYSQARKHYVAFIAKCNACHHEFADGEHILKP